MLPELDDLGRSRGTRPSAAAAAGRPCVRPARRREPRARRRLFDHLALRRDRTPRSRLPSGRVAQYAADSASPTSSTMPSTRTWRPSSSPVEDERGPGVRGQLAALARAPVGVEDEPVRADRLEQHEARRGAVRRGWPSPTASRSGRAEAARGAASSHPADRRDRVGIQVLVRAGSEPYGSARLPRTMATTRSIDVRTEIPGPRSRRSSPARSSRRRAARDRPAVVAAEARGATMTDVDGNTFVDFAGGVGCLNVGHSHPQVVAAVRAARALPPHRLHDRPVRGLRRARRAARRARADLRAGEGRVLQRRRRGGRERRQDRARVHGRAGGDRASRAPSTAGR